MSERTFTGDEVVDDLNTKFFAALVNFTDTNLVVFRVCYFDVEGGLICETETEFLRRFPRKVMIDGKRRSAGWFWLNAPRRRQVECLPVERWRAPRRKKEPGQ